MNNWLRIKNSWAIERDSMKTMKPDLLLRVHLCNTLGFFSVALMRSLKSLLRTANLLASWESEVLTSVLEYTYKSKDSLVNKQDQKLKKMKDYKSLKLSHLYNIF